MKTLQLRNVPDAVELLGALPDLGIDAATIVADVEAGRSER